MASFKLSRLPVNWKEQPQLFERYWDETLFQIEKTLNAILEIPAIRDEVGKAQKAAADAQAAADMAQDAAKNANSNAGDASDQAQKAAEAAKAAALEASLVNSYTSNYTSPLITSNASGFLTIKDHTRVYGDSTLNPSVPVTGGTLATGAAQGDVVRVYYSDPDRSGGSVVYQFTLDSSGPGPTQKGSTHSVGAVSVPATGTNNGKSIRPPGYVEL